MDLSNKLIGFLGMGHMGHPISNGLSKCGFKLMLPSFRRDEDMNSCFDDRFAADYESKNAIYEEMLSRGCVEARSLKEMAESCDVFMFSLPDSPAVESVVLGEGGILENIKAGSIVIDLTSADPMSTRKLCQLFAEKGVRMLDAPISGGVPKAMAQTLSMMVGGEENLYKECLPILNTIGNPEKILYVGPSGAGHALKACNNFLSAATTCAHTEALAVATLFGIDPHRANEVISNSSGRTDASLYKYPTLIFPGRKWGFTQDLMLKDVATYNRLATALRVPNFMGETSYNIWTLAAQEGSGSDDNSEVISMYERWNGVKFVGIDKNED